MRWQFTLDYLRPGLDGRNGAGRKRAWARRVWVVGRLQVRDLTQRRPEKASELELRSARLRARGDYPERHS
jgi:hypothetical protein